MKLIPAIDLFEGRCVRLTQGAFSTVRFYDGNPFDTAKAFADAGLLSVHVVDLSGAKAGRIHHTRVLEGLARIDGLSVEFSGGLHSDEDVEYAFACGAAQVSIGSVALREREMFLGWLERYGAERVNLSADAHNGIVLYNAWQESSTIALRDYIHAYVQAGVRRVICTDTARDGMLQGPAEALYATLLEENPAMLLTAGGGVASVRDLLRLRAIGLDGAIIGKALYEKRITLTELAALC